MPKIVEHPPGAEINLRARIMFERAERGWSMGELARRLAEARCPMNQSSIQKIEKGDPPRRITLDEALAFARVFGMSVEELTRDSVRLCPMCDGTGRLMERQP